MTITDSLIGRRLANFQIERPLGRGGMAQVYYGLDVKLRRPVAIKVIDARYRDNPTYAERFVREAQVIATWRHENIIQIYYADDQDGFYYFAMEYIDGADLSALLAQHKGQRALLPQAEVLRIGRAVASALDYAHRRGIIHRDIKPSNILMAKDGRVVLADFGLAMDAEQGSMGEVVGSAHYVSPEQARNSAKAVPQSDVYSLGIVLYEMLTGKVPFDDPSATVIAVQHLTKAPPRPRQINPGLTVETEAVLLKALSKKPEERFHSASQLLEALAVSFQPVTLKETQVSEEFPPLPPAPRKTNSLVYLGVGAVAALLLLALLVAAGAIFFLTRRSGLGGEEGAQAASSQAAATSPVTAGDAVTATLQAGRIATSTSTPEAVTTPSPEPPAGTPPPTETPLPQPQRLAHSQNDFAETKEGNWLYLWAPPGTANWQELRFDDRRYGDCWYAEDYVRICPDAGHPGNGADIAWYWRSQVSGPLEVRVSVAKKDGSGGDGVEITVYRNPPNTLQTEGDPLFQRSLEGGDKRGFTEVLEIDQIEPGESLLFVLGRKNDPTHDETAFITQVCLYRCP